jgi:hypothetical protein
MDAPTDNHTNPARKRLRSNASPVWEYFLKLNDKEASCTLCVPSCVIRHGGGTSSLHNHLAKHGITLKSQASTTREEVPAPEPPKPCSSAEATALWVQAIAENGLALRLVEVPGFRNFLSRVAPTIKLPTRQTLSAHHLPAQHKLLSTIVNTKLTNVPTVFICADGWTSRVQRGYIGVVIRGISWEWERVQFVAGFVRVRESDTAAHLSDLLLHVLKERDIALSRVGLMSTDGAANYRAMIEHHLKRPWAWCMAHLLHLVVLQAINGDNATAQLVSRVRQVAKHYKVMPSIY